MYRNDRDRCLVRHDQLMLLKIIFKKPFRRKDSITLFPPSSKNYHSSLYPLQSHRQTPALIKYSSPHSLTHSPTQLFSPPLSFLPSSLPSSLPFLPFKPLPYYLSAETSCSAPGLRNSYYTEDRVNEGVNLHGNGM